MNKKRLLKMADFVETIPRKDFDMGSYMNECGTVGCALGWAAKKKLFRGLKIKSERDTIFVALGDEECFDAAAKLFDITNPDCVALFLAYPHNETPEQVAGNIRRFVETGKLP